MVRYGYFNDTFSLNLPIEKKAEILKQNLDLIAEKSKDPILLPIGADHLGIPIDIKEQIESINEILKEEYHIKLSSPFEYLKKVENNFKDFYWNNELRDNSKTFVLQGCYSSRLDLKKENVECTYLLDLANRFLKVEKENKYNTIIEYAYKLLLQNQAHDSICGCSTDDVHKENLIRYKKIKQIANTIIDELKFKNNFQEKKIINLSNSTFSGIVEFTTTQKLEGYEKISYKKGFDNYLLTDTNRIPVTEDYTNIYTYLTEIENLKNNEIEYLLPIISHSDLKIATDYIKNKYINLKILNNKILINKIPFTLIDFVDQGDSYNHGPKINDTGSEFKITRTKIILNTPLRVSLRVDLENNWDVIPLIISLDNNSNYLKFEFSWNNSQKNHLL